MTTRTISVGDVLNAMELDNVPLKRGGWFDRSGDYTDTGKVYAACILGQCAINLGVTSGAIMQILDKAVPGSANQIISMNDTGKAYAAMVEYAKVMYAGKENVTSDNAESIFYLSRLKEPAK